MINAKPGTTHKRVWNIGLGRNAVQHSIRPSLWTLALEPKELEIVAQSANGSAISKNNNPEMILYARTDSLGH